MSVRRREGFTLIEMLVVVGIMIVLLGIGAMAFQRLDKAAAEKATRARLETCTAILNEYELSVGNLNALQCSSNIIGNPAFSYGYTRGSTPSPMNWGIDAGQVGNVNMGAVGGSPLYQLRYNNIHIMGAQIPGPIATYNPGLVSGAAGTLTIPPCPYGGTGGVFYNFMQVPSAKLIISQMPPQAFMASTMITITGNNTVPVYNYSGQQFTQQQFQVVGAIPIDAWRNPIIFVPSGGMTNIYVGGPIPPASVVALGNGAAQSLNYGQRVKIRSLDQRPFFASAGPDGNFQTGDDNVYSCPVATTAY